MAWIPPGGRPVAIWPSICGGGGGDGASMDPRGSEVSCLELQ